MPEENIKQLLEKHTEETKRPINILREHYRFIQKVSRKEFAVLEKRVSFLEAKLNQIT